MSGLPRKKCTPKRASSNRAEHKTVQTRRDKTKRKHEYGKQNHSTCTLDSADTKMRRLLIVAKKTMQATTRRCRNPASAGQGRLLHRNIQLTWRPWCHRTVLSAQDTLHKLLLDLLFRLKYLPKTLFFALPLPTLGYVAQTTHAWKFCSW